MKLSAYSPPTTAKPATTAKPIETTPAPQGGVTTWSSHGVQYKPGDVVIYNGVSYKCVFPHTSFPGAEPSPVTWAWWQRA